MNIFDNEKSKLLALSQRMKDHALEMFETLQFIASPRFEPKISHNINDLGNMLDEIRSLARIAIKNAGWKT